MTEHAHHPAAQTLSAILTGAVAAGASDVHLRTGSPPFFRDNGQIVRMGETPVSAVDVVEMIRIFSGREIGAVGPAFEFSFDAGPAFRVRAHAFRSNEGWGLALRLVPAAVPGFADLRLPPVVKTFAQARPGLVLVTGPMGSGKSTTSAAMLQYMAGEESIHIVTLEDPIEYRLRTQRSCVSQRELGRDAVDLPTALRDALREDPDVLFIGELRDSKDLDVALHAADMGVGVFATFHTHGAAQTLARLVAMHPVEQQIAARERIAESLRGVLSQRLVARRGSASRVLATEVLVNTYSVKECVRDPARQKTLPSVLERGGDQGMHTFDQSLLALCSAGIVDVENAASLASSPGNLRRALNLSAMNAA